MKYFSIALLPFYYQPIRYNHLELIVSVMTPYITWKAFPILNVLKLNIFMYTITQFSAFLHLRLLTCKLQLSFPNPSAFDLVEKLARNKYSNPPRHYSANWKIQHEVVKHFCEPMLSVYENDVDIAVAIWGGVRLYVYICTLLKASILLT